MREIVIFGNRDLAEMAHFYFTQAGKKVKAFTLDNPQEWSFKGCPVFDFKDIVDICPPKDHVMFAPIYSVVTRKKIYNKIKDLGYNFTNFVHDSAHIWHPRAVRGDNVFIQEFNNIQYGSYIGHNNILWAGNHIGHHSHIGHHCYFTSHVVLSGHCKVEDSCWFGVNSTIRNGLSIAEGSFIGAHSYVSKNIPDSQRYRTWIGTPAMDKGPSLDLLTNVA